MSSVAAAVAEVNAETEVEVLWMEQWVLRWVLVRLLVWVWGCRVEWGVYALCVPGLMHCNSQ